jgi:hypothetical protein
MKIKKRYKIMIYGLAIFVPLLAGFQIYTVMATNKTEMRPYKVLKQDNNIEVRHYPPVTMASVEQDGDIDNRNGNFGVLAGYIFGGNEDNRSIAMTTPVEMGEAPGGKVRMSFMMPTEIDADSLPEPNDSRVKLHQSEAFYAVSIRFGGWSDSNKIKKYEGELRKWMKKHKVDPAGERMFMGYNPPYQLVNRRNEVLIPLTETDALALADAPQETAQ